MQHCYRFHDRSGTTFEFLMQNDAQAVAVRDRIAGIERIERLCEGTWQVERVVWCYAPTPMPPLDMILFCPLCGFQHIDAPDPKSGWTNPPHRSHLCGRCKASWRPADFPTYGVAEIKTCGFADTVRFTAPLVFHVSAPMNKATIPALESARQKTDGDFDWLVTALYAFAPDMASELKTRWYAKLNEQQAAPFAQFMAALCAKRDAPAR